MQHADLDFHHVQSPLGKGFQVELDRLENPVVCIGQLTGVPMVWTAENRGRYDRRGQRYPSDLTNEEWAVLQPLLPVRQGRGRPRARGGGRCLHQLAGPQRHQREQARAMPAWCAGWPGPTIAAGSRRRDAGGLPGTSSRRANAKRNRPGCSPAHRRGRC